MAIKYIECDVVLNAPRGTLITHPFLIKGSFNKMGALRNKGSTFRFSPKYVSFVLHQPIPCLTASPKTV